MNQPSAASGFPANSWKGRCDDEEHGFALRWHQLIGPLAATPGTVLLGFACDAGVTRNQGRAGAAQGPAALRQALANVPLARPQVLYDAGDITCLDDELETAQGAFADTVAELIKAGHRPVGLGGGHEIAFASACGLFKALVNDNHPPRIGIINFDAHFDLRAAARGSSGTPFRQISERCTEVGIPFDYLCLGVSRFANTAALFQRAEALGADWRLDEEMSETQLPEIRQHLERFLATVDAVYLTLCLDVLPPYLAPGVSAPSAHGVQLEVIEPLVERIAASGKLRLLDVAELNPTLDVDQRTARVAARLIAQICEAWA